VTFYADPRPRRRPRRNLDVTRLEESRGWLGTQLRPSPMDAPPLRDGASEFNFATEELCDCGAGEHESCSCFRGVHRAEEAA
jgi:hypothetical protein